MRGGVGILFRAHWVLALPSRMLDAWRKDAGIEYSVEKAANQVGGNNDVIYGWTTYNQGACLYEASGFNPTYWNASNVRPYNNCYNYATNRRTDTFAQPGRQAAHAAFDDAADGIAAAPHLLDTRDHPRGRGRGLLAVKKYQSTETKMTPVIDQLLATRDIGGAEMRLAFLVYLPIVVIIAFAVWNVLRLRGEADARGSGCDRAALADEAVEADRGSGRYRKGGQRR